MAKEKEMDNLAFDEELDGEGKGSKILSAIIGLVIFVILLGTIIVFIKLDIGGVGTGVLRQYLKNVPVVNQILPSVSNEQLAEENGYRFSNISDAVAYIEELEAKVKELEDTNEKDTAQITELEAEVERLKVFEAEQEAFNEKVKEFETNVVFNEKAPDIAEYKSYYEQISPDNAAKIYEQVVERSQVSTVVKEQAERYSKMEAANAASALEVMTSDLDLVADILTNMSTSKAALIMQEMSPDYCAKITKKMSLLDASN